MDVSSAFTYMFDDEEWIKKIAIGGVALLLGIVIVPVFTAYGYMLQTMKNVRDNQPTPLPEWNDFGDLTLKGLMVVLIGLVYSLPVFIPFCLLMVIVVATPQANPDMVGILWIALICLVLILVFLAFLASLLFPAAIIRYAQYDTFGSAFQLREIFNFISGNIGDYIIIVLLGIVAGFVAQLGIMLCGIGFFFTSFWSVLVTAHLYGQLARRSLPAVS